MKCRFCETALKYSFVDLGMSPPSNSYLTAENLNRMEPFYPLHSYVCEKCFLVQLPEYQTPAEIFSDYAYFSSYSDIWLKHARDYTEMMVERFKFNAQSLVVELASNDGYLLQYFKQKGVPVLGIEPAENVAKVAREAGIPTLAKFFGRNLAQDLVAEGKKADLIVGNNVLAHVPDLNDFVQGMKTVMNARGVITMEFPHLMRLMEGNQFDTIYHEHFSYFSFTTVDQVFATHGLRIFDVEEIPTHGGSLRIYARHESDDTKPVDPKVGELKKQEESKGYKDLALYKSFGEKVKETKRNILEFFIRAKREGKSIVGYGAPAKGNTLLNYCGVRTDFIEYTVDRSPHKQGRYLPGTHIPIFHPDKIRETRPDFLFILPWNIKEEIMQQMAYVREWGGKFVVPIPKVEVL